MAPVGGGPSDFEAAALARRKALSGASGPLALLKNLRVFGIACFACLGGLLYGYNQGVFSGVLTMPAFKKRKLPFFTCLQACLTALDMGNYIEDQETLKWNESKQGWLVAILELGAWLGTMYSGFLAEILSRKYAILVNVAVFIIGVIVQCTAIEGVGHNAILGGRFVTGRSSRG
jgi:MFS family permease